ncbi:ATP-binding protein, partial [Caldivirga sp.]|uniref:ATP-binding protein n=1 Tax=Caldivirga sp. TaxID=2080243 RepID=UPI003D0B0126
LRLVEDWGSKGMVKVQVVYGPEGCGKTAWLLQSIEALRGLGFEVIYVNPINKEFVVEVGITSLRDGLIKLVKEALAQNALGRLTWLAFDAAKELIKATKGRIAVIVDDAFQVIGVKESALYVKALLNLIEYPPEHYERIVTIAATSEGLSRHEIGRHRWASLKPMWNMTKDGFERLYEQIPGSKPSFEDVWLLTGGNPKILEELYRVSWRVSELLNDAVESRMLRVFVGNLTSAERMWLWEAVEDPDTLFTRERMLLMNKLVELNLVIDDVPMREDYLWIDQPPPEKDSELGIGKYVAWQTPLHREAVRRALQYT